MSINEASTEKPKKSLLGNLLGGAKTFWAGAIVAALTTAFIVLAILGTATARTTYYVLNKDVPARTQITPEMLTAVETTIAGAPTVALTPRYVAENAVFSKVPMQTGDVLSTSTVAPLERIDSDLPAGFVVTSFQVTPENAVAGKVRKGDYIDMIAINGDDVGATAKVVLHHVLVLDVTVAPDTIADAATSGQAGADINPGPESEAVRGGIPAVYTVAVSPVDATKIALVREKNLLVTLSANDTTGSVDAQTQLGNIFDSEKVGDSGAGTEKASESAKVANGDAASAPTTPAPAASGTPTTPATGTTTTAPSN